MGGQHRYTSVRLREAEGDFPLTRSYDMVNICYKAGVSTWPDSVLTERRHLVFRR